MKVHEYREMMRYLTRKPTTVQDMELAKTRIQPLATRIEQPETDYQTEVQPDMVIPPQDVLPKNPIPNMPSAPGIPDPQFRQIELATGGRVNFNEGSKLTGTDKTLEKNIRDDHKAFNDYRKSIGSPTIPLDNEYIKMWIRSRLNSGGPVKKETQKIIPLNLESVAFKLFQDKLDNLSYNQKQTVYDYIEDNRNKKATGGRVNLANGTEEPYNPEIPSLGFSDPIDILEQRMINEKDPIKVEALNHLLENAKKERKAKEMEREEFKKSQKEKGIKYKEDFPSEAAYFAETGKQLLTNPKYFLGKGAKGVVEGTEFLVGQPLKTLFNQEGKNFEFYQPVAGEKLGINKFIEENIPKGATTGTLIAGDVAEIAGSVADPFLAYGLAKGAIKGTKAKPPTTAVDETIDPTRRDILKTGAVMGGGALLYPTAKKIGMFDELAKAIPKKAPFVNIVRPLGATETQFPEWFPSLVNRLRKEGNMKPIYATKEVPLTKEEYLKLRKKGKDITDRIYDEHLNRTQEYIDEFEKTGKPRYYQVKDTDDIIGYEYIDKNLPDVKAVEYEGQEMNVYFKNNYGQTVEVQYVAPGKKSKEGDFAVADARPEPGSGYDSAPDFEQVYVKDIDEVLGGSGEVEKYATKAKTRRSTKGAEEFEDNEIRALIEIDRLKDEGIIE